MNSTTANLTHTSFTKAQLHKLLTTSALVFICAYEVNMNAGMEYFILVDNEQIWLHVISCELIGWFNDKPTLCRLSVIRIKQLE